MLKSITNSVLKPEITRRGRRMSDRLYRCEEKVPQFLRKHVHCKLSKMEAKRKTEETKRH